MEILKETNHKVLKIGGYSGVCDACQSPIVYSGELLLIEIERDEDHGIYVPIDILACPYCSQTIGTMKIYKLNTESQPK